MKKEFCYKIILLFLFIIISFNIKLYAANSDFTYELDANNYAIITSYKGSSSEITIPSNIDGYEVKKIKNHAFNESRNSTNGKILKNVIISEGITEIGDFAFIGCSNLESITLPNTLISLGDQTFIGCSKLNKINIPSSLKKIETYVFQETGIKEMVIHKDFKSIGSCAFRICTQLKSVKVYSKNVTYAEEDVFEYCSSNLVLYGYEGSTTQTYANQKGIKFQKLSDEKEDTPTEPIIVPVTSITLNKTSLSLEIGESETIIASILPDEATDKTIIWTSNDPEVATVENGKITANKSGEVIITASTVDWAKQAICSVTVTQKDLPDEPLIVPVTSITLNKTTLSLYVGDSETLTATVLPNNATEKNLNWFSSDTNVATVENGKIIAKNSGETTITVSAANGEQKDICKVTVLKKDVEKVDNTTNKDNNKLPQTGEGLFTATVLFMIFIFMVIWYKKYKNLKEI